MQTIHKYPLEITGEQEIEMPKGASLLSVQMQHGAPCLWALVSDSMPMTSRKILIRGTGHNADNLGRHISTFQMDGGDLVFHAFESEAA